MTIPDYLTRYAPAGEYPFRSLNELPLAQANEIKRRHCRRNGIEGFYAEDDYLVHRREIEAWMAGELRRKGGHPKSPVPVYMVLGESPASEFDIRVDIQKDAQAFRIPLADLDLSAVTFTYPDSMYELEYDESGSILGGRRTNTPRVYTFEEVPAMVAHHRIYEHGLHYIEAQVWDPDRLQAFWERTLAANPI